MAGQSVPQAANGLPVIQAAQPPRGLFASLRGGLPSLRSLALAALLILPAARAQAQAHACPDQPHPAIASPRLAEALARPGGARIVAFGSSSTAGSGASDAAHTYPAVLEARLRAALGPRVTVLNRGVGGEDADAMIDRITRDTLAERPDLVVWQLGANAAMRQMNPDRFAGFVRQGVGLLRQAGIDVVLMDNQRAPRITAHPGNRRFDAILAGMAATTPGAFLFSRGALMDAWEAAGVPAASLLIADGLHHNDRGYACLADALAGAILAGLPVRTARAP